MLSHASCGVQDAGVRLFLLKLAEQLSQDYGGAVQTKPARQVGGSHMSSLVVPRLPVP